MTLSVVIDEGFGFAANIANAQRNIRAEEKASAGYSGPRIMAQGDSWFCYPIEFLKTKKPEDVVRQLGEEFAVWTMAVPGRRTNQYVNTDDYDRLMGALTASRIDVLLLSGGGNDLVQDGQLARIVPPSASHLEGYLSAEFHGLVGAAMDNLELLIRTAMRFRPGLKVVFNGYAHAFPRPDGIWFGKPLGSIGIKPSLQRDIVKLMLTTYNAKLTRLALDLDDEFGDGTPTVIVAKTLTAVPKKSDWFDELHPDTTGFAVVVTRLRDAILRVHPLVG